MVLTLLVPTMATLIFSWNESTSTTMKPPVCDVSGYQYRCVTSDNNESDGAFVFLLAGFMSPKVLQGTRYGDYIALHKNFF